MKKKKSGFTLIEVIVALGAFMIVMLAITTLLITTINYTGMNRKTFNTNTMSKAVFEAMKENRIVMPTTPSGGANPLKIVGDPSKVAAYKATFNNEDEAREYIISKFLNATYDKSASKIATANASDFTTCKGTGRYSMGIKIQWSDLDPGTAEKGVYEIETWCWDTNKGESTLVNRKTFLAPK